MRWAILLLALIEGGWLAFDGAHALLHGDYVTPSSGPYAGQLGPWSRLVEAVGLEPRSAPVKLFHLGLGGVWLVCSVAWSLAATRLTWALMLGCAVAGLWYLPFGTLLSVVQILLLWRWSARRARR